mgnify:CR=1 FL=1
MNQVKVKNDEMIRLIIEALEHKQKAKFKVTGSSMRPFFNHGKTTVTLSNIDNLATGDIILFEYQNQYLLHRIIKFKDEQIIAQGDALSSKEMIKKNNVIGVVVSYNNGSKDIDIHSFWYVLKVKLWRIVKAIFIRKR